MYWVPTMHGIILGSWSIAVNETKYSQGIYILVEADNK